MGAALKFCMMTICCKPNGTLFMTLNFNKNCSDHLNMPMNGAGSAHFKFFYPMTSLWHTVIPNCRPRAGGRHLGHTDEHGRAGGIHEGVCLLDGIQTGRCGRLRWVRDTVRGYCISWIHSTGIGY